jgi:hypothetical protein
MGGGGEGTLENFGLTTETAEYGELLCGFEFFLSVHFGRGCKVVVRFGRGQDSPVVFRGIQSCK